MSVQTETTETEAALAALQGMAVECVTFDRADRPKRRRLLPLAALLAQVSGGEAGLAASRDAT